MADKYGVKVGVSFDEQSASRDLNDKLQKLADKNKLKLGLSNEELKDITRVMKDIQKNMTGKLQLDNSKAMQSLNSLYKEVGKIEQTRLSLFNEAEVSRVDKIRHSLIETERIKTDLTSGDVSKTIVADYEKAYKSLGKLFEEEYSIRTKLLGKNKEDTEELNTQLNIIKERQATLQSELSKANIPSKELYDAEVFKKAEEAKSLFLAKQKESITATQQENKEVSRLIDNYQKRKSAELEIFKSQYAGLYDKKRVEDFQNSLDNLKADGVKNINKEFQNLNAEFKSMNAEAKTSSKALKAYQKDSISTVELLNNAIQKMTMVFLATQAMKTAFGFFKDGVKYSLDLNKALTEVSMVTNQTQDRVYGLAESYRELSYSMSVLTEDTIASAVEYYRQGLNQQEVMNRVAKTTQYAKITNEDFKQSAELLTATVNSMGVDIERATDVFIKLGDSTATSGSEMARGLQKVGGQASAMNVEFEKMSSWLATISARTREAPESIGTGLKSMMARYQQLTEEGYVEEDGTRINDVAKALSYVNMQITDAEGNFKNYATVMDELGSKWEGLDNRTKAYIQTAMAGSYQASRFSNLMEGYGESIKLYETALDSAGTTQQKYNLWLDSSEASINRVKEQMTTLWSTMFDVRGVNELATGAEIALVAINKVADTFGTIPTLLASVAGVGSLLNANIKSTVTNVIDDFGDKVIGLQRDLRGSTTEALKASKQYKGLGESVLIMGKPLNQIKGILKGLKVEFLANAKNSNVFTSTITTTKGALIGLGTSLDFARVKMIALKMAMGALQLGIGLLISSAITKAITYIHELTQKQEKLSEALKEQEQTVQQNISTNNDYIKSLSGMAEEYDKLSSLSPADMSNEQQERFIELQNEIAQIAPETILSYDEQGNAIVSLTDGVSGLIKQLERKNELERMSLASGWVEKQKELQEETDKVTESIEKQNKEQEKLQARLEKAKLGYKDAINKDNISLISSYSKEISEVENQLAKNNSTIAKYKNQLNDAKNTSIQYSSAMLQNNEEFREMDKNTQSIINTLIKGQGIKFTRQSIDELVSTMKNPAIDKFVKQLENIKANPKSIKNLSEEIDTLSKKMVDVINKNNKLDFKIDSTQIKQIFGLDDLKRLEQVKETQKEVEKSFKDSQKALQDYTNMLKQLNEEGELGADSVSLIMEHYENLIPLLGNEKALKEELIRLQDEEKNNAIKAIEEKLKHNEFFFQQILNKSPELVNALKRAYGVDFENFKTYADAKQRVNSLLVDIIGEQWNKLYSSDIEALEEFIDTYESAMGATEKYGANHPMNAILSDSRYNANNYNEARAMLDLLKRFKKSTEEVTNSIDLNNLVTDKSSKGSKKASYEVDSYANAMKLLKTRIDELNGSMNKLHKNTWDYTKALQTKQGLVKQEISLTEQEIARQLALTQAQSAPEGKDIVEIRDKAYQKTLELRSQLVTFKAELDRLNVERYTSTIGIMDDKLSIADRNAEIYKIRAEKWSGSFKENFKQFDLYIKEISSRTDVLLEKQKYIQNQIWSGSHTSAQIVQMRKDLMEVVQEIDTMTHTLTEAFQAKWDFKIEYDNRTFKKFDDDLDIVQDKMDILNEKDIKYEDEKQKLLVEKTNLSKSYIMAVQQAKVTLLAERDTLNKTTEEWNYINNKVIEYDDKIREITKSLIQHNKELKSTLDKQLDNLSSMEQKAMQIIKKRYEKELEDYKKMVEEKKSEEERRHKKEIDNLDKERKAIEEKIKLKLKDLDRSENQRDYEKTLNKLLKEQADLQYKYNALALTEDTREGKAQRQALREKLIEKQSEIDELRHKRGIDLRKENLNDALETEQKAIDEKKKAEDEKYEANKKRLDKELKDTEAHYKELTKNANLYSEARKAIMDKEIKYIDGKLMDLTDAFIKYEEEWGQGLSIIGAKIKSDLIENLDKAYQTATNLTEILKQLDTINKTSYTLPKDSVSGSANKRVFALSDSNKNINDFISSKKHLESLGYQVIDASKLSEREKKNLNLTSDDIVVGQALKGYGTGEARRVQGSDRYETAKQLQIIANNEQKVMSNNIEKISNTVYGWGKDLENAQKWLSAIGYKFVNTKDMTPEELSKVLKSGDVVLGGTGVSPISDEILRQIGAVRLAGQTGQETLEAIIDWAKYGGVPKFHSGGVMPHEGLAFLDEDEVILTPKHQKDFFAFFESLPNLKGVRDSLSLANYGVGNSLANGGLSINGGFINIYGNVTNEQLSRIENVAKNDGVSNLSKLLKMRGARGRV